MPWTPCGILGKRVMFLNRSFSVSLWRWRNAAATSNHALQSDFRQKFVVSLHREATALTIELRDPGPEFDPTKAPAAESPAGEDSRPPGGWGIQLVRRYMDEIHYRREPGENVLRLTKRFAPECDKK